MDGYMYAIFKNHGRALLGYLNYGMEAKGPTRKEVEKAAEVHFKEVNLEAKRMKEMTAADAELIVTAEALTIDRVSEIDALIDECETYEAALRLDSIRLRLTQLAKRKK